MIVSIGDSSIPGEAGRWAGNTNRSFAYVDTGPNAYLDLGYGESIVGCHRSNSAEVHIGVPGVLTKNLACSGAMPRTYEYGSGNGRRFKPGLDTFAVFDSSGNLVTKGQLLDKLECVAQARAAHSSTRPTKPRRHANYFGQLALRSCLRQAWNNGAPKSGYRRPTQGGEVIESSGSGSAAWRAVRNAGPSRARSVAVQQERPLGGLHDGESQVGETDATLPGV